MLGLAGTYGLVDWWSRLLVIHHSHKNQKSYVIYSEVAIHNYEGADQQHYITRSKFACNVAKTRSSKVQTYSLNRHMEWSHACEAEQLTDSYDMVHAQYVGILRLSQYN